MKTPWMNSCDDASYNSNENPKYKKCPHCGSHSGHGSLHLNEWTKRYYCGTILKGNGNVVKYIVKCPGWEKIENRDKLINEII